MSDSFQQTLNQHNILSLTNQGVTIAKVTDPKVGIEFAKSLVYALVDKKTILYLSGGSLKALYELLAAEEKLEPGGVGLVDERFGPRFWEDSNEKMFQDTKFLRYLQIKNIPFYPILQNRTRMETAEIYDAIYRNMNHLFPKSIGLLGIGPDGHTSSIAPNRSDFQNPWFTPERKHLMVSEFDDPNSQYHERIGMTFLGLSMLDVLLVTVFGETKLQALKAMFEDGPEEEIPARFFKRAEIAKKTILITDQNF